MTQTTLFGRSFDEGEEAARMIEEQGETDRLNFNFHVSWFQFRNDKNRKVETNLSCPT